MRTATIKRFYKNKQYIGIRDHEKDSFGEWQDIRSAKIFTGKPSGLYQDEMMEFTPFDWEQECARIKRQAVTFGREYVVTTTLATSYPIWRTK